MEHYVGQFKGKGLQKPSQFKRERRIGEHKITLPKPPKAEDIANFSLPKAEQKFIPYIIPKDYDDLSKEERIAIQIAEWKKRRHGAWFYNNGTIEYITGAHYFYISYWKIDVGLPGFRDSDRDLYYVWDYCVKDEDCYGLCYFTNRRSGKTYVGTSIIYEYASRKDWNPELVTEESECGIQSKTNPDAKGVFKKLISSWKKLDAIWKPVDSGETNPQQELRFEAPSKRSTKGDKKKYDKVLNSIIGYKASTEDAYDGKKLKRYYCDEFGKYTEGNAYERWDIVKPCLVIGTKITGKAYFTTTVEELERKGGKEAKDIYDNSDTNNRKLDGRTVTGMYRLFKPSYYGLEGFINEYGYSDIPGAKTALLNQRDGLEGNKLASEVRKFPFTIKEAFFSSTGSNTFSSQKIFQQKEYNENAKESLLRRGNFIMTDEETKKVEFFDDPDGFFTISQFPEDDKRSLNVLDPRGLMQPMNTDIGCIGVDPYDHNTTVDNKQSEASANLFKKFQAKDPYNSNCFIMNYLGRRADSELFYKDIVLAAIFFGVKVLVENQKPGLINMMTREGYTNYIYTTKQSDYTKSTSKKRVEGVSMSGGLVRNEAINTLATYIYKFVGKISHEVQRKEYGIKEEDLRDDLYGNLPFPELLDGFLAFEPDDWTDHDSVVSSMITLLGVTPVRKKNKVVKEVEVKKDMSFFPTYSLK
jgi:hypothetical protein